MINRLVNIVIMAGVVLTTTPHFLFSQEQPPVNENDTIDIYQELESFAERSRFTEMLYRLLFIPTEDHIEQTHPTDDIAIDHMYGLFEGKIIRNIHIHTAEPFMVYSGRDTISGLQNFVHRAGNSIHVTTRDMVIRNLMLIGNNQPFNSYLVKESERLIRSRSYISDVTFFVEPVSEGSDSVDITIHAFDRWSITPAGSVSSRRVSAGVDESNFLGWGHSFFNGIRWNHQTGNYSYNTRYYIPNIRNTFINSTIRYGTFENGNFVKQAAIERPFYSSYARWAGGIDISQYRRTDSVFSPNFIRFRYNSQDVWGGHAIRLFRGSSEYRRSTNLVTAARMLRIRYVERPHTGIDTLGYFADENFYLATVGISARRFVRDQYLFKFGITEDVPVGQVFSITGGHQVRNGTDRFYLGALYYLGDYYSWGYMSAHMQYGTFYRDADDEEGILDIGINYFTNLLELGNWRLRQFAKPQLTLGFNRAAYDSLTINREYGIKGFYSPYVSGTRRLMLTTQTQLYAPWNIWGFRFGPFVNFTFGMVGNEEDAFRKSRIYSQIGLGVLVKNENLVLSTFQLSISFFPVMPGIGDNIFRFNSLQNTDYRIRDFDIEKPGPVIFR